MALADIGEDTIVSCSCCSYAANLEKAAARSADGVMKTPEAFHHESDCQKIYTPNIRSIDELSSFLEMDASAIIKTLVYIVDGKPVAVLVRGDHEVNEIKLANTLGAQHVELADSDTTERVTGAPVGFAGPIGLAIPVYADQAVADMAEGAAGANEADFHYIHVMPGRHFQPAMIADFRNAVEGDACARCEEGMLRFHRGIEVGHVFKLGTKYSEALGAKFVDQNGREQAMIMGCYGIGVSRILSAVAEQSHDSRGIIWPAAIAPYQVHIIPVSVKDESQMKLAEELYGRLTEHGIEVLLDDRDERPGVKFNDSDLFGIPYRLVVGKLAANAEVEFVERRTLEKQVLGADAALARIIASLRGQ